MSNLYSFFGLAEMARGAGSFGKIMRAALEKARQYGEEFTVKQFCDWLLEAGAENANPGSVGIRLTKMTASDGQRPDAMHPLIVTKAGRRGPGGTALLKYVFDGPAGAGPKSDLNKPKKSAGDDIPYEDEDEDGGGETTTSSAPSKFVWPKWLPQPDPDGGYAKEKMAQLQDAGFGSDAAQMWADIATAEDNLNVDAIIKNSGVPPQFQRAAMRVAQEIFANLNKPWDAKDQKLSPRKPWVDDDDSGGAFSSETDDDDEGEFLDAEPEADGPEATQAGASNFLKPDEPTGARPADRLAAIQHLAKPKPVAPAPQTTQAPPPTAKRPSVSKFFRR